ncbi:MAG TPA: peptidylprolyl isomerase [Chloroflexota bacterium]
MTPPAFRTVILPLALVLLAAVGCGTAASGTKPTPQSTQPVPATPVVTGGSVAAVVNGHDVPMSTYLLLLTLSQRQTATQPNTPPPNMKVLSTQTMQSVVIDELIRQYAATHHITVTSGEIAQQELNDTASLGGQKAFQQRLTQLGLTRDQYKQLVIPSLLGQKVEQRVAPATTKPQTVANVRHILISPHATGANKRTDAQAKALAVKLLGKIKHGASFAALAKKYSDDPGSSNKGGVYTKVTKGQMVPQFDHAAFTLPAHQPEIIHTQFGYHIIEVLSRGKAQLSSASQQQVQRSHFLAWINAQLKKAKVQRIAKVKGT